MSWIWFPYEEHSCEGSAVDLNLLLGCYLWYSDEDCKGEESIQRELQDTPCCGVHHNVLPD